MTAAHSIELSVIVPAFREEARIYENMMRLIRVLDQLNCEYELIVVSDGNTDQTEVEARRVPSPRTRVLAYSQNMGKGFALMHGVRASRGNLVAFIDSDLELHPEGIVDFVRLQRAGHHDVVIGSKRHPRSVVSYPKYRRIQSYVYQLLIKLLFNLSVSDTQTGLKLFRGDVVRSVVPLLAVKRFAFDLELLVVADHLGYRNIVEAPVQLDYEFESTTNLRAAYKMLWDTAAIFYRLNFVRYYDRRAHSHGKPMSGDSHARDEWRLP